MTALEQNKIDITLYTIITYDQLLDVYDIYDNISTATRACTRLIPATFYNYTDTQIYPRVRAVLSRSCHKCHKSILSNHKYITNNWLR